MGRHVEVINPSDHQKIVSIGGESVIFPPKGKQMYDLTSDEEKDIKSKGLITRLKNNKSTGA